MCPDNFTGHDPFDAVFSWKEDPAKIDQKPRLSRITRIDQNQKLRRYVNCYVLRIVSKYVFK